MISDRIYSENFEVVLGQDKQDIYDLLSSLEQEPNSISFSQSFSQEE